MATYIPQKAEDAAAASGDLAVPVLGVRNDAAASKTDTDGDYSALATDAAGRVGIADLGGSITVDGSVTATAQPGVDIGDVTVNNASGGSAVNIQDGGNSITVDGTVAVSSVVPGTGATNLGKAEESAHADADVGVMALAVTNFEMTVRSSGDGRYAPIAVNEAGAVVVAGWDQNDTGVVIPLHVDAAGTLQVNIADAAAVTGLVAHDTADSGNPVKVGGRACATSTAPTAVSNNDRADMMVDDLGRVVTVPHHARDLCADITPLTLTSTTAVTDLIAADANNMNDILSLVCINTSTSGTEVILYNDDGTTVRWGFYVPASDMRGIVFNTPLKGSAVNKKWKIKCVTSIASLTVYGQYVKNGA